MLPPPARLTDTLALADWLELWAVLSPDGNSSRGDLETLLIVTGSFSQEEIERSVLAVFSEIEARSQGADVGYPFFVRGGMVRVKDGPWDNYSSYLFCLCLTYFRGTSMASVGKPRERIFEVLCTEVARQYVGGEAVRFGSPRIPTEIDKSFKDAVDTLCRRYIGEGSGFRPGAQLHGSKDGGLDIVAWRHEHDRLPGKLLLFGACAAGRDWDSKLSELHPEHWCREWIGGPVVSPIVRTFFVPHRIEQTKWEHWSIRAGIMFDRCRIARWARQLPDMVAIDAISWSQSVLGLNTT